MRVWLHFIGKQYYSRGKFVKEAKQYGVTRRVSLQQLKKMAYGDMVLLAMMDSKSPVVFGSFVIDKISGLSPAASAAVKEKFECEMVSEGGSLVVRGCGMYIEGARYAVKATLREIVDILEELKEQGKDIGLPMVGGRLEPHKLIRLKDIPFRQGFREIDYDKILNDIGFFLSTEKAKAPVTLRGQYYASGNESEGQGEGMIEEVKDYSRASQQRRKKPGSPVGKLFLQRY
jgi:hypothetical protein